MVVEGIRRIFVQPINPHKQGADVAKLWEPFPWSLLSPPLDDVLNS
jgi:hypothetical protein